MTTVPLPELFDLLPEQHLPSFARDRWRLFEIPVEFA